jgi:hypothetical protein
LFFNQPEFAFLFCYFAKSGRAGDFCKEKAREQIIYEIDALAKQARAQLESSDHLLKQAFIAYLDSK